MKTKFIVAGAVGIVGITSLIVGTVTFAGNTSIQGYRTGIHSGAKMGMGSGARMMGRGKEMMNSFASTGEAEAFRTAVDKAIASSDYTAFVAAHTKYNITEYMTKEEFTNVATMRATQEKIKTALEKGDYTTWKTLSKDDPMLTIIDTEAKFKQLQEMHSYQEKARTIGETLGLPGPKGEGMGMGMKMGKGQRGMGEGMRK